jgi:hypothetical protein
MAENSTTLYFRDQMRSWSNEDLLQALQNGLPWHEHVAARGLIVARRRFGRAGTMAAAPREVLLSRRRRIARFGLYVLLIAATVSFVVHSAQAARLRHHGSSQAATRIAATPPLSR